jgi:tRNA(fMet)-specific endonuclease VapC
MWHLDTDIVVAYLRGNQRVAERIKAHLPNVAISSLVLAEALYGARISARAPENVAQVERFLHIVEVAVFDAASAEAYSHLQLALRKKGLPTGEIDALIAATALANHATLVSHNTKHYANVQDLLLEDWLI